MDILIVGAGISGLTLAWNLEKQLGKGSRLTLLEAQDRVGGSIRTIEQDGALFECGPRALKWGSEKQTKFIEELGILDEMLFADEQQAKYLVYEGKLQEFPSSLFSLLGSPLGRICLRGWIQSLFKSRHIGDDESVSSFFSKVYGASFTKHLIDPLIRGIFACTPCELSIEMASRQLGMLLGKRGPKTRLCSFRKGLEFLPRTIAQRLLCSIELSTKVLQVQNVGSQVEVVTNRKTYLVDQLYTTVGSLFDTLDLPRASVRVVSLGYLNSISLNGFGFLAPSHEEEGLLGITFDSHLFLQHNGAFGTRLTLMLKNDALDPLHYVKKYLLIDQAPDFMHTHEAREAIPTYPVNFQRKLHMLTSALSPNIRLLGMDTGSLSVTDCIEKSLLLQ